MSKSITEAQFEGMCNDVKDLVVKTQDKTEQLKKLEESNSSFKETLATDYATYKTPLGNHVTERF